MQGFTRLLHQMDAVQLPVADTTAAWDARSLQGWLLDAAFRQSANPMAIFTLPERACSCANRAFTDVIGFDPTGAGPFDETARGLFADWLCAEIDRAVSTDAQRPSAARVWTSRDGDDAPVFEFSFEPILNEAGGPCAVLVSGKDGTRRRARIAPLLRSDKLLGLILEAMTDHAIVTMSHEGRISEWSAGAERLFGVARADALGRHIDDDMPGTARWAAIGTEDLATVRSSGKSDIARWHERPDGTLTFLRGSLRMEPQRGTVLVARDATGDEKAADRRASIAELTASLGEAKDLLDVHGKCLAALRKQCGMARVGLAYLEGFPPEGWPPPHASLPAPDEVEARLLPDILAALACGLGNWVEDASLAPPVRSVKRFLRSIEARSMAVARAGHGDRPALVAFAFDPLPHARDDAVIAFMEAVAERAELAIERLRALKLREQATLETMHRLKNVFTLVGAAARFTFRSKGSKEEYHLFCKRIAALAQANDALFEGKMASASVHELVGAAAAVTGAGERVTLDGARTEVGPAVTLRLGMLLHELSTNATKYGSLSVPDGIVRVAWKVSPGTEGPVFELSWTERDGPPAYPPSTRGFGSTLIGFGLTGGGDSEARYEANGFSAMFRISARRLAD